MNGLWAVPAALLGFYAAYELAGLFLVPYRTFLPATTVASAIWATVYYAVGLFLGERWGAIVSAVSAMPLVAIGALLGLIGLAALVRIAARRRRHRALSR